MASSYTRPDRWQGVGTDVWTVFTPLSLQHKSANLGQGFPTFPVDPRVKQAAAHAVESDHLNQYVHTRGLPRLRQALAKTFTPLFDRQLDTEQNIVVTQGATEGTFVAFLALLNPGDEVILIEPFYDMYVSNVTMAGGVPVFVPLRVRKGLSEDQNIQANDWVIDMAELEAAVSKKTKAILINTPHNPVGKVFSKEELTELADFVKKHNLYVVADEVYERITYDFSHVRIATLPGMWERTITIGSAGKTFSVTGWKVGWLIGPADIITACLLGHARIAFCVATPLQDAVASSFEQSWENKFFEEQNQLMEKKRDDFLSLFRDLGIPYSNPNGSYFFLINTSKLKLPIEIPKDETRDWAICKWMTTEIGVTIIPPSAFYSPDHKHLAANYARVCFCKSDETYEMAKERLPKLKQYLQ